MNKQGKMRVGVVADDITGANDIGLMFAKNGMRTAVFPYQHSIDTAQFKNLDVMVLDTDSRLDAPHTAAEKVAEATKLLQSVGFDLYYNKTCSVFRGNIGAEFDSMQDVLQEDCSMVVLGLPKLGRTTVKGIHYLDGIRLDESPFINDPIHPTKQANLAAIIALQSSRACGHFDTEDLDRPSDWQRQHLEDLKTKCAYIIFDVRGQEDLQKIAYLIRNERNICGSSGICEELPAAWGIQNKKNCKPSLHPLPDENGTLVLAGSLTEATRAQVQYLKTCGYASTMLDPALLLASQDAGKRMAEDTAKAVLQDIVNGRNHLVYTQNDMEAVQRCKTDALHKGMNDATFGKMLSAVLGQIAKQVLEASGAKKLIVAGGDTSMAVSSALGLHKMVILSEIEPGVPAMYGYGDLGELLLVLKSGSFGSPAFLQTSEETLRRLQQG